MKPIEHELAHALADVACDAGEYELAIELLERAAQKGRVGALSSIRTMNRLLNMRERLKADGWHCEACGGLIDSATAGCQTAGCSASLIPAPTCDRCDEPLTDTSCPICDYSAASDDDDSLPEPERCEACGAFMDDCSGEVPCCSNPHCEVHP